MTTDEASLYLAFTTQKDAQKNAAPPSQSVRLDRLRRLLAFNQQKATNIIEAISADFGHRAKEESQLVEILAVRSELRHLIKNFASWMRPQKPTTPLSLWPARARVLRQPLGVVGIISPWNYPHQLALNPCAAALAAGNTVLIKPSELTPAYSALLQSEISQRFDPTECAVITGDAQVGAAFSQLSWDHLFFTGSCRVGRQVAQQACASGTPVTLELGGKSPVIIDPSADMARAARRIAFAKCLNSGQTCIAPDYALVPALQIDTWTRLMCDAVRQQYPTIEGNPDYSSIISAHHLARLHRLLEEARQLGATIIQPIAHDPQRLRQERRMPFTLVLNCPASAGLLHEEIFGPILPILPFTQLNEAIALINAGPTPLALYWFGQDKKARAQVLAHTRSGGVTINDALWHIAHSGLPFGGLGASGHGAYHAESGFRLFSHERAVFLQTRFAGTDLLHPPYGKRTRWMHRLIQSIL